MNKEDKERIKAKIRAELQARLLAGLEEKVERVFAQMQLDEAARIDSAINALVGASREKKKRGRPARAKSAVNTGGCRVCGYEIGRARGRWSKSHSREEHRAAIEGAGKKKKG